jgi:hypothetical protein
MEILVQCASPVGWGPEVDNETEKGALALVGADPWPDPRPGQRPSA